MSEDNKVKYVVINTDKKPLIIHLMQATVGDRYREIDTVKKKIHHQDFMWKKRIFPIPHQTENNPIWTDKKGVAHLFLDVNESTGTLHLTPITMKKDYIDKCEKCHEKIGIDSINVRDLLKRKTISAIWGIDQSHIMLLLIIGIIAMILGVGIMYMYGETQKLNAQIITMKNAQIPSNTVTANMILGEMLIVR